MVVEQERKLLKDGGHEVAEYIRRSDDISGMSVARKAELPLRVTWSLQDQIAMMNELRRQDFDVIHLHNSFPLISPSILAAARQSRVPVVATLHNYRLVCAAGTLLRDGGPCFECLHGSPLPAITHACYRDSRVATAPLALSIGAHRALGTWQRGVERFIVMSKFAQGIMTEAGLPAEKITIKPHFVPTPSRVREGEGTYGLYLGRLSVEKGVATLIEAWDPSLGTLMIAGDGPLRQKLEEQAAGHGNSVRFLGSLDRPAALELLLNARYLVSSSKAFETFGLSVVEAFAHGVPAVVPNQGVFPELVRHGQNGFTFQPGDPLSLRRALQEISDPAVSARLGAAARVDYLSHFTPTVNLNALEAIYGDVVARKGAPRR
ncbi:MULTISPECIES: glycosyltransferase family 4 protein [unclassified Arthrobacter]|uniref:glycosyltransferase family 4 protein n=1 Tax=unclassified Arthrobacter TaxID=235627 RepID=UPI002DFC5222|nr:MULTISPECIES: glycosyltransferase family 4 protein [unclassified Arthrobacter]MEC5190382.1 glycosyltransferase involved in cell wall biosynthesis [Arthrobacter sp. MP_M4]MEC5201733.1 glycosyltransferase involved in cell wall biosynthesis [Arthrobacter sp. MP_M7]